MAAALLAVTWPATAALLPGKDYGGANLTLNNGDVLSGTFTNVGLFTLPANTTAYVNPATNLAIYASTVQILGTLDGSGRGQFGGNAGQASNGAGGSGTDGSGAGTGAGAGGAAAKGGAGGAGGANGGGGGSSNSVQPSAGGLAYGSTGTITIPLSADDAVPGSGGGGGGANTTLNGANGAAGGAAIYIEAASMTVTGVISVNGSTATPVSDGNVAPHPGGGGGGGGGTILLRITGQLQISGAKLTADGGKGGNVDTTLGGVLDPGGGGGGGRIKLFGQTLAAAGVTLSTAPGAAGFRSSGFSGIQDSTPSAAGSTGTVSFGVLAAPPSGLAAQNVYVTSISWNWTASPAFGDGPSTATYRVYGSTSAPLPAPQLTSTPVGATETGLSPNTTYFRVVTAYTDWGDSLPSNSITTHTLANVPGAAAAAFSGMADVTATFNWTANAPANPGYTVYEVDRSSDVNFGQAVSTGYVVGLSSAPAGLLPNTTYYWRVRAVNIDGIPSAYAATAATATLATAPSAPAFGSVFVTSVSFTWAHGANPPDTLYEAQVSTDNFFTLAAASDTLAGSATFFNLTPGTQYFFRTFALNRESVASAFSAVISTRSGNLSDVTAPTAPGQPVSDRQFSYDGAATFSWAPSQSSVGILDYHLIIGSTPGGNDVVDVTTAVPVYQASGLATGRSYYARVAARSNAGVVSQFSAISMGLPVFIPAQSNPLAKAINWPNPFDPSSGPTQIGFVLDAPADVEVKIFTLNGRQVHSQSYSFGAAGNQIVTWDGHNDSGGKVAPGGYIGLILKKYAGRTDSQKLKIAVVY